MEFYKTFKDYFAKFGSPNAIFERFGGGKLKGFCTALDKGKQLLVSVAVAFTECRIFHLWNKKAMFSLSSFILLLLLLNPLL